MVVVPGTHYRNPVSRAWRLEAVSVFLDAEPACVQLTLVVRVLAASVSLIRVIADVAVVVDRKCKVDGRVAGQAAGSTVVWVVWVVYVAASLLQACPGVPCITTARNSSRHVGRVRAVPGARAHRSIRVRGAEREQAGGRVAAICGRAAAPLARRRGSRARRQQQQQQRGGAAGGPQHLIWARRAALRKAYYYTKVQ